jgi:NhaA family Na+:H+ antiporter
VHYDPSTSADAAPPLAIRLRQPLERFIQIEAASGIVLLAVTVLALIWANSPWSAAYEALWHLPVRFGFGAHDWEVTLHFIVNDGLMTVFFLVVGLEIRRELHDGALADARRAIIPVMAALGGVVAPALIYLALSGNEELRRGWAVPTATDIAFAVGVLTVLGKRVPHPVRVLLLALAVIDDVIAILVIAFFYSSGIDLVGLGIAGAGVLIVLIWQRLGARSAFSYVLPGAVLWLGLLRSGVHPTLAGVILGLLTPAVIPTTRERLLAMAARALEEVRERVAGTVHEPRLLAPPVRQLKAAQRELLPPVERVEMALHPWVAFGIMPLFAFANAGVRLDNLDFTHSATTLVTMAIAAALVLGKPLGILLSTWLTVRTGLGALGPGLSWRGVLQVGALGGIGFTMSIFLANLAFPDPELLGAAKFAVLVGSSVAGVVGLLLGRFVLFR